MMERTFRKLCLYQQLQNLCNDGANEIGEISRAHSKMDIYSSLGIHPVLFLDALIFFW